MFTSLLLAHCTADFLLQPSWLIALKNRSWKGIVLHGWIHSVTLMMVLWPGLGSSCVWLCILLIASLHGLIDWFKIRFQKENGKYVIPFFIDQILHALVLALGVFLFQPPVDILWIPLKYVHDLLIFIGFTVIFEMVCYQFLLEKNKQAKFKPSYKNLLLRGLIVIALLSLW